MSSAQIDGALTDDDAGPYLRLMKVRGKILAQDRVADAVAAFLTMQRY